MYLVDEKRIRAQIDGGLMDLADEKHTEDVATLELVSWP